MNVAFSCGELKILKLDLNLAKVPGLSTLRITCAAMPWRRGITPHRQGIVAAFLSTQDNPKPDVTTPPGQRKEKGQWKEVSWLQQVGLSISLSSRTQWVKGERRREWVRERERGVTGEEE